MDYTDESWLQEKYYEEGFTQAEMADIAGKSRATITRWMQKHDMDVQPGTSQSDGPYKNKQWLEKQYHEKNKSSNEIARECGVTKPTIKYWMDKFDIDARDMSEAISISWEGADERKEKTRELFEEYRQQWWEMDEQTQKEVRERLSEWWSENNPMEGRTKEQNPAWKGGGNRKYYGPNWEEQRQKRLEKDNHTCQRCGESDVNIVHHHIPIREWREDAEKDIEDANQLWNLVTVCEGCHGEIEGRRYAAMNTEQ